MGDERSFGPPPASAAAVLVAAGAAGIGLSARTRTDGTVAATSESPSISLAAAVRSTAQTSYRFTASLAVPGIKPVPVPMQGAYDPAGQTGYLRIGSSDAFTIETRLIGSDCYIGNILGRNGLFDWDKETGSTKSKCFGMGRDYPVDPDALFDELDHLGDVTKVGRSGSGDAAVDTYKFSYVKGGVPTTGIAEVGVKSGKLEKFTVKSAVFGVDNRPMPGKWYTVTYQFSDFGTPVRVDRP